MDQSEYERLAAEVQERVGSRIAEVLSETDRWAAVTFPNEPGAPFLARMAVAAHVLAPHISQLAAELEHARTHEQYAAATGLDEAWHGYLVGIGNGLLSTLEGSAASVVELLETASVAAVPDSSPGQLGSEGRSEAVPSSAGGRSDRSGSRRRRSRGSRRRA